MTIAPVSLTDRPSALQAAHASKKPLPTPTTDGIAPALETPRTTASRPQLAAPGRALSIVECLEKIGSFETFGQQYLATQSKRLAAVTIEIERISADNIQKIRDAAEKATTSDVWSFLKKIATAVLAAISTVLGLSLVASGGAALVGGAMIASGILSIANLILSEAGFWESLAKTLAKDNEETRKKLAMLLPAAVGLASGAIGLLGAVGTLAWSSLNFVQQTLAIAHAAVGVLDGVTTMGKGVADARALQADADLIQSRQETTLAHLMGERVSKAIEGVLNELGSAKERASRMLKMLIQSNLTSVQG